MADSLAALDVHDGLAADLDLGSSAGSAPAETRPSNGSAGSQREAVHDSSDDRFFDATEDEVSEDGLATATAQLQGPPSMKLDAVLAVGNSGDGGNTGLGGGHHTVTTLPLSQLLPDVPDTPFAAQNGPGHEADAGRSGLPGSLETPLAAHSPEHGLATTGESASADAAAAAAAAAFGASRPTAGLGTADRPASASSVGLSVRSSVTFPSLAELASPVTPDFAMQVRICLLRLLQDAHELTLEQFCTVRGANTADTPSALWFQDPVKKHAGLFGVQ